MSVQDALDQCGVALNGSKQVREIELSEIHPQGGMRAAGFLAVKADGLARAQESQIVRGKPAPAEEQVAAGPDIPGAALKHGSPGSEVKHVSIGNTVEHPAQEQLHFSGGAGALQGDIHAVMVDRTGKLEVLDQECRVARGPDLQC